MIFSISFFGPLEKIIFSINRSIMNTLLQINSVVNIGSTGKIAEQIGQITIENNWDSYIAYGRKAKKSRSKLISIGSRFDKYIHGLYSRLFDRHGFASKKATENLVKRIDKIQPNVIGLHNIHGYYLHVGSLFEYLKDRNLPVIWTLHDCWPYTGHCIYYEAEGCEKWETHCKECPLTHTYPKSILKDNSFKNFDDKRKAFTGHPNLTIVTPSHWLRDQVKRSFLQNYPIKVIHNGIDLTQFRILKKQSLRSQLNIDKNKKVLLGVANIWEERKGLPDFINLQKRLNDEHQIVLIGLSEQQIKELPEGIKGISRTESVNELVEWYNIADIFVNPTYEDNFPTTNIEALACGTPVITYNTGGSPEAIDDKTGLTIPKGDLKGLNKAVNVIFNNKNIYSSEMCRERAEVYFNKDDRFIDYFNLYQKTLHTELKSKNI